MSAFDLATDAYDYTAKRDLTVELDVPPLTDAQKRAARHVIAGRARGAADARGLLAALGLIGEEA
ncbi:MAG TPA: hypothetical protein VFJ14_11365 [Nocardioidaceae bacterium]|nr:hypothetical protein [Nocardioidaceae bacterium]